MFRACRRCAAVAVDSRRGIHRGGAVPPSRVRFALSGATVRGVLSGRDLGVCADNGAATRRPASASTFIIISMGRTWICSAADSLFELLCAARTPMGEDTLARWLLAPAGIEVIRARQACIADLRDRIDLREELTLQGESARIDLRVDMLLAWAQAPNRLDRAWIRWTALLLAGLAIAAASVWAITGLGSPFWATLAAEAVLGYSWNRTYPCGHRSDRNRIRGSERFGQAVELHRIAAIRCAAAARFADQVVLERSLAASAIFSKLATTVNLAGSRRNPLLAPLMLLVMYPLQAALAAERWRSAHGHVIRGWLDVVGEFEALVSLAPVRFRTPARSVSRVRRGPGDFSGGGSGPSADFGSRPRTQ